VRYGYAEQDATARKVGVRRGAVSTPRPDGSILPGISCGAWPGVRTTPPVLLPPAVPGDVSCAESLDDLDHHHAQTDRDVSLTRFADDLFGTVTLLLHAGSTPNRSEM